MQLDVREIIDNPGKRLSFDYTLNIGDMVFDSVLEFTSPLSVSGEVVNEAGMLVLTGALTVDMRCQCARCLAEFPKHVELPVRATLVEEIQDEDNTELFLMDGTMADLDEIFLTAFVLNMDQRFLCKEDCKGLCPTCGKDLNEGPCNCGAVNDPRLAVLGQLLEKE